MTVLSLEGVTRQCRVGRRDVTVLDDVSLDVVAGEHVAIWGMRRAGKSALLRVMAGIEPPTAGRVLLDGCDLGGLSSSERARRLRCVGYAPKDWRVAQGKPVVEHVALPLIADGVSLTVALARAHDQLDRVGATDCADAAAHELAPGDVMRVALARALVRDPRLLLVDEPALAPSPRERDAIQDLLRSIVGRGGLALVVASRDASVLRGAQRVMSIGDGRVRAYDSYADVLPFPLGVRTTAEPVP